MAFVVTIAVNYPWRVKNCASTVYWRNLRNHLPGAGLYRYQQNHRLDNSPQQLAQSGWLRPPPQQGRAGLQAAHCPQDGV